MRCCAEPDLPKERQMLLNMAETWEGLAVAREKKLAKEGKTEND